MNSPSLTAEDVLRNPNLVLKLSADEYKRLKQLRRERRRLLAKEKAYHQQIIKESKRQVDRRIFDFLRVGPQPKGDGAYTMVEHDWQPIGLQFICTRCEQRSSTKVKGKKCRVYK